MSICIDVTERLTGCDVGFPFNGTGPLACLSLFPVAGFG